MADQVFSKFRAPRAGDSSCGPDLELEGDNEFFQFDAQVNTILPSSFASFDRRGADLPRLLDTAAALIARSYDLRTLCHAAKLAILDRKFGLFVDCVETAAAWLDQFWEPLNPALIDGDAVMRLMPLQSLDDGPHVIQPLQSAPLLPSRRLGAVSLRSGLLLDGKVQPRMTGDDPDNQVLEKVPTASDIQSALDENKLEVVLQALETADRLAAAVGRIEEVFAARSGSAKLTLPKLTAMTREVRGYANRLAVQKDPTRAAAVPAAEQDGASGTTSDATNSGAVGSRRDMRAALAAASGYFGAHEPSSPVRMIIAQAQALADSSFLDALSALAPDLAGRATMRPAGDLALTLPIERLAGLLPTIEPTDEQAVEEPSQAGDGWSDWSTSEPSADGGADAIGDRDDGDAASQEEASAGETGEGDVAATGQTSEPPPALPRRDGPTVFTARTRAEAISLMDSAAAYLRVAEPSSPVPLILDHGRAIAGRDFLALLRDMVPLEALRPSDN